MGFGGGWGGPWDGLSPRCPAPSLFTLAQNISVLLGAIGSFLFMEARLESRLGKKIDEQGAKIDGVSKDLKELASRMEAKFDKHDTMFFQLLHGKGGPPPPGS